MQTDRGEVAEHHAGELAYRDSFGGNIPCTVISVEEIGLGYVAAGTGQGSLTVRYNVTRGGYRRGEVEPGVKAHDIVPRDHHRYRGGHGRINVMYAWVAS